MPELDKRRAFVDTLDMQEATPEQIERDLAFAIDAGRLAGERVMELRALAPKKKWEDKFLADIGDQASDGFLNGFVAGRYPDDGVLSEETADSPERLSKERTWILDPLDGTKEYSQMREDWGVHVALTIGGECALATVALPSSGQILWGVSLPGHERSGVVGLPAELVRGDSPGPGAPRIVVSRSHTPKWVERFCQVLGVGEMLPCGSAGYKTSRILFGQADIYVHKVGLKEWDTCAPETIARSLGWSVCKLRGEEHRYNRPDPKNHEFVVCRPAWRDRVIAALAESGALAD
jgi:3'(2'), 5'-bisphosphate nucleotidase